MSRPIDFLNAVLGSTGTIALTKALTRVPGLDTALVPRAVVGWIERIGTDYHGAIPGIKESHFTLVKSEAGYSGVIAIGTDLHVFDGEPLHRAAAGLAVALGAKSISEDLKRGDVSRLAKSIDDLLNLRKGDVGGGDRKVIKLIKARTDLPGQAAAPLAPKEPVKPVPQQKAPAAQGNRSINLTKTDLAAICPTCGDTEFEGERFKGCKCLAGLSKSVKVKRIGGKLSLSFAPDLTLEDISVILETIKDTDNG